MRRWQTDRYFKYMNPTIDIFRGRVCGKTPKQAATKSASLIFSHMRNRENAQNEITFQIKEITRGSTKKIYHYRARWINLEDPLTLQIRNHDGTMKRITFRKKILIKRIHGINTHEIVWDVDGENNKQIVLKEPSINGLRKKLVIEI